MNHELTVDEAGSGKRIDLFVGEALSLSRAKLKALFEEGRVKLNGKKTKKGMLVVRGDRLQVEVPDARGLTPDDALPLRTLHVDEALVFIDKPAGVPSQPLKPGETGTIANALVARFPEMLELGDDEREAGLVHRLDVETSGVLRRPHPAGLGGPARRLLRRARRRKEVPRAGEGAAGR